MMEFFNVLVKKLPTWRGITMFFYVASHWDTISNDFEEYRRQIKDREEWSKAAEAILKRNHEEEKQRIFKEHEEKLEKAEGNIVHAMLPILESYATAVARLAIHYLLNPLEWELERDGTEPQLRRRIESLMPRLPPPPRPAKLKTLKELLIGDRDVPIADTVDLKVIRSDDPKKNS